MLFIGPHLVRSDTSETYGQEVESTGQALEFATPEEAFRVPLYRRVYSWEGGRTSLDDLVFPESFNFLDFPFWSDQSVQTPKERFIPLGGLVCALYSEFKGARELTAFLSDIREKITLSEWHSHRDLLKPELICPELRKRGFDVLNVHSYGRAVSVEIGWIFPQDRSDPASAPFISIGTFDFRPLLDGSLKPLAWPKGRGHRIGDMLCDIARSVAKGSALLLLSDDGRRFVWNAFEWTPLARLSAKQARAARTKFVRENIGLVENPKSLAASLKAAGLYSPDTSISQICKYLPSIIAEATQGEPA